MSKTPSEIILDVLTSQRFASWYASPGEPAGRFEAFITCDDNAPTREEILNDIEQMFKVS
jgi:hypothetical protein